MEELMNGTESTVITYTDYGKYKAELDAELQQSAETMTLHEVDSGLPAPDPVPQEESDDFVNANKTEESEEQQLPGQDSIENHPEYMSDEDKEKTRADLQKRAYNLVNMVMASSMSVWKDKIMPLEAVKRNREKAEELIEVLKKLERKSETEV